jgi:outer membrane protein assembly factor BamB
MVPLTNGESDVRLSGDKPVVQTISGHDSNFSYLHRFPEGYFGKSISDDPSKITVMQNSVIEGSEIIVPINDGMMDSSWPMYCHDTKHTGRSPYNTADNPMTEEWRHPVYGYSSHIAPVLDSQGTIYVANSHICAIYPNGTLKWEFAYGSPVEGGPAIDEQRGVLYYGIEWDSPNYLYALYLTNGSTKWKYPVGNDISSSPAIDPFGNIYFGDWSGNVHAVYPDGTRKWIYHTGDVITSSPAIDDNGIYIGSHDDYVYAFYPNGDFKWRFKTGNWVHASPTLGEDGTVYIGSDDGYLYALNPENGSMIWRCLIGYTWCSPTLGQDGMIYLGVWDQRFSAIYPNGTIKWTYNAPGRIWFGASAALSKNGILYFGTTWMDGGTGAFIALKASNGKQLFIDYFGWFTTSPSIAKEGTIYSVSTDPDSFLGILHAFGSGEQKKIEIQTPQPGKFYLFNHDLGRTFFRNTIVIGNVTIKVSVSSPEEIQSVDFHVGFWIAGNMPDDLTYSDTTPPYEWNLNTYIGNYKHWNLNLPFDYCFIQVTGRYKDGCEWSELIPKFWYFHLLKT